MRVKKEINIQIGEQIKKARESAKMTQELFAEAIDVSPQYVSDLERGVVGASVSTIKRICTALHVPSDQILFGVFPTGRNAAISGKCRNLSDNQFRILLEIIDKYVEAIESKE